VATVFVLNELFGDEQSETIIIPGDRSLLTFGRSPLCSYQLLADRGIDLNKYISKIQASLQKSDEKWFLHSGCIEAVGNIKVGPASSPFFIESSVSDGVIEMVSGSEVILYREINDHATLICLDGLSLETRYKKSHLITNAIKPSFVESCVPSPDDTHSFDVIDDVFEMVKTLSSNVEAGFSGVHTSLTELFQSERNQNSRLDDYGERIDSTQETIGKMTIAGALIALTLIGGSKLFTEENRKDLVFSSIELLISGGAATAIFNDAVQKRSKKLVSKSSEEEEVL
jgi:hypothetical protein